MAKTLKEALLEQMTTLQERGLAPGEIPDDQEEETSYASYQVDADRRSHPGERNGDSRQAPAGRSTRVRPRTSAVRQQREPRELRQSRPSRERREPRGLRESLDPPYDLAGPPPAPARPALPPRPPLARPRPGSDWQPSQPPDSARPAPRTDLLRRNAERIQREQAAQDEIRELLTQYGAVLEPDPAAIDKFFEQLTVETGALPPLDVVAIALRNAGKADPAEVGNQVRLHYRTSRSRVTPEPVPVG